MSFVRNASFRDFEAFAASSPGCKSWITPLQPGFSSKVTELVLGDVMLRTGRSTPLVGAGSVNPATVLIVLPLTGHEALKLNGREVKPGDLAVYGPGASHNRANHRDISWALLMLPAAVAEAMLKLPRCSADGPGAHAVLRADRKLWKRAASLVRSASGVAQKDPNIFEVEEARRALRSDMLDTIHELLGGSCDGAPLQLRRATPERHRIVRAAEDYLRADPSRPVSTADLCAALGLSPSRLRSAFTAVFSISAERYLLLRRLAMVRSGLRSADPRWTSVGQIAAAHGFWDLALFTQQYQEAFGEAPLVRLQGG